MASEDFTVIDYASIIDALLDADATVESILSEDSLTAAAWAYKNDTLRYTKLRQAVPKEIGIRNYERAVKQRIQRLAFELDYHELVCWIEAHKKEYVRFIMYGDG